MIEVCPGGRQRIDRVLDPGYVARLAELALGEMRARRNDAAQEETDLSYLRRLLHARIDIVRAEQQRRREGGTAPVVAELARILAANAVGPATGSGRFQTLEPSRAEAHRRAVEALVANVDLSDVGSLSGEQLDGALQAYGTEEAAVSQRRREVQRVVDTFNAEIGSRYASGAASVDDLLAEQRRLAGPARTHEPRNHEPSRTPETTNPHEQATDPGPPALQAVADPSGGTDHQSDRAQGHDNDG